MPLAGPAWWQWQRTLLLRPTLSTALSSYRTLRLPRPVPEQIGETPPGLICWGAAGSTASPEPRPTIGFIVKPNEEWREWGRKSEPVRIENPDDPSQYIMDSRPTQVDFDKAEHGATAGSNTAAEVPPGISNYANTDSFVDSSGKKTTKVRMHYVTQP